MNSKLTIFWVRLTNWEYWPWYIVYIPVFIYWLWCGLKARAIFWISAVNPGFEYGGIIGASKFKILSKLPAKYIPKSVFFESNVSWQEIKSRLSENGINFPLIIKPDIGERGFHVALINTPEELESYTQKVKEDHLVQEYLDMPVELGIFYYRLPNQNRGKVSSVVRKRMLMVVGDGESTILQLLKKNARSMQQVNRIVQEGRINLEKVLPEHHELLIEPIGNHIRGTAFIDANYLINDQLVNVMDNLAQKINGFYYGRFDLRCDSISDLYEGKFKVMELNGAASEPAHIYSPNYPLFKGLKELIKHWQVLYKISIINHHNGVEYMSFRTGWEALNKSRFTRS